MRDTNGIAGAIERDWCILRTTASRTLALATSLEAVGIEAWTPVQQQSRRRPRTTARIEITVPITPTFVFARAADLPALAAILAQPIHPHPGFSLFRHAGKIPIVHDHEIANLRAIEQAARRAGLLKKHRHVFRIGEKVTVPEGSFAGMSGVVEDGNGRFAVVGFGGNMRIKVATFLLKATEPATGTEQAAAA